MVLHEQLQYDISLLYGRWRYARKPPIAEEEEEEEVVEEEEEARSGSEFESRKELPGMLSSASLLTKMI